MGKRVNIMLPESTLKVLDRIAGRGDRSRFISQAVLHYAQTQTASNIRKRLKEAALSNANVDLDLVEEWFPAEQEAWQRLEREERASKTSRAGVKSTSRRSTRRQDTKSRKHGQLL